MSKIQSNSWCQMYHPCGSKQMRSFLSIYSLLVHQVYSQFTYLAKDNIPSKLSNLDLLSQNLNLVLAFLQDLQMQVAKPDVS